MSYVVGIDTGGTYTDAVLLDTEIQGLIALSVRRKQLPLMRSWR